MQIIHLKDLVSINFLEGLLGQYHEATGMASCITDFQGRIIANHEFNPVCEAIRNVPELEKLCIQSDAYAGLTSSINREPYIYECPCGLVDCTVPIFIEDTCIGHIMTGQVLLNDESMAKIPSISNCLPNMAKNINTHHYKEMYKDEILILTLKEVTAYTKLLKIIAQLISAMGYQNIMNAKYKEQEFQLLEEERKIAETDANISKLKLNLLENQLPITFLYESFNSIYQQAIIEEANETADIIFSLSALLRRRLYSKKSLIPLEEEIDYIKNYINLKNLSRHFKVTINEEILAECLDKIIPITLLQSIIEHVFFMNIDRIGISSTIRISAKILNDKIRLGLSCDHVELPLINVKEMGDQNSLNSFFSRTTCISLNNLLQLLSAFYNESYQVDILETPDQFGELVISLPVRLK